MTPTPHTSGYAIWRGPRWRPEVTHTFDQQMEIQSRNNCWKHDEDRAEGCERARIGRREWRSPGQPEAFYRRTAEIRPPGRSSRCGGVLIGRP
ncbi:conserved hypothetical protein [Streptomyces sviceus ATCC 29083]|uniref:Uncharacterized protein n=1 Tax=Streptomyces sviceus (strain ATCC 29083 / DSM 924 / JCM 4929 / NBRC 13980 / NCIMB 11184 / NRRL 5439 / UC 5370) TaxID=463191 RepID=B5HP83_STRX2|nr:conserved hypothetical protein [Streptomyces sviceus ATCC 29083]